MISRKRYMGFGVFLFSLLLASVNSYGIDVECGQPEINPSGTFIVGGNEARPHSWPWMTMLKHKSWPRCGGALISPEWVVTAAHCFDDGRDQITDWTIHLGKHYKFEKEEGEQQIGVDEVIIHPSYNISAHYSDIALVRLNQSAILNAQVSLVCLPPKITQFTDMQRFVATGWGHTYGTGPRLVLNQVTVPYIPGFKCSSEFKWAQRYIHHAMLCAGFEDGEHDTCGGDSGGPLVYYTGSKWILVGVTSWGPTECAAALKPGVYVRLPNYVSWIHRTMFSGAMMRGLFYPVINVLA